MKTAFLLTICILSLPLCVSQASDEPLTAAERTNFAATSSNAEVLAFLQELAARSPLARLTYIGTSSGGSKIPMLILGNPAPARPAELINDDRLTVYIQANIHAGEVEGKEATLMLARDIARGYRARLLDKLVILVVPNLNPDGNDRLDPAHRSYQGGPKDGVGLRPNSQNLDLNRDWIKLETPEVSAVVEQALNRWDPALLVDCHTTNGSYHQEPMTFSPQLHPSGDSAITDYVVNSLLPAAVKTLKTKFGHEAIPYGTFMDRTDPSRGWATFGHQPRYTTNYYGMRNRLSVLTEAYAYADFRVRIESTYGILVGMLEHVSTHSDEIGNLLRAADARAYARENDELAIEVELQPYPEPVSIKGYVMEQYVDERGRTRTRPTEEQKTYVVPYYGRFAPTRSVAIPAYYLVPSGMDEIVAKIMQHGIAVERLTRDVEIEVERFTLSGLEGSEVLFQGHRFTKITGEWKPIKTTIPAGTGVVSTAQPLGMLAAMLLEPESDDGLVAWNFLDRYLARQWRGGFPPYPILRIRIPDSLPTELTELPR